MSVSQSSLFDVLFHGDPTVVRPLTREECLPPRSRKDDPLSSKRAEAEVKQSGTMKGQRLLALELVKQYPGRTSKQLAELGTLDRYQLARRLSELKQMHEAHTTQNGSEDLRWWPK